MMQLTAQERRALQALLRAGVMARDALAAIADARAADQRLPTDEEIEADSASPPDYGWWATNPAVPAELRHLLEAAPATG